MDSLTFFTIDNEAISLSQSLKYLRQAGSFQRFVGEILRQYILEKELASRAELSTMGFRVNQAIMDFRYQNKLLEPDAFQGWLNSNGITFDEFQDSVAFGIKVEDLKIEVTEPKLESYFVECQPALERVLLSRIIVIEEKLALDLKAQILGGTQFERLANENSLTKDRNGLMPPISRSTLPEALKKALELAKPGDLIGPLQINERYCLFRVEDFLPAILEGTLKQELQNQLFDRWLNERLQGKKIKLEIN